MELPESISWHWLRYDLSCEPRWRSWLSEDEHRRLAGFRRVQRRRAFLLGRAAARQLLAERLGVTPERVPLVARPDEPPQVPGTGLFVSIAHADEVALAAVAPHPIGADLERIRPRPPELYRYVLHPDEYSLLRHFGDDPGRAVIWCWAFKEAVLKGLGVGLRCSPRRLRLALETATCGRVLLEDGTSWQVWASERDGYVRALAWPENR
ncbi:4'-phosphopantetheinyl transferase family protein [Rhodothermus marinus]|uniref:4'-phosphopantetheinyl transferase n=1 Tax=Rhodothermus marinus (strain ATCC 43812 / DSM 4252 / R-10) TaxID=518766 RepID=D0MH30_RHOM4|nr:4'-phosphopantetheinyl transferase superfamily protein [Rhodothermus marinus]ACY47815.1 4'-phosphopantetheinyl transferase [Rhodothermus marinus DSM 4252]AEN73856.1 4'-phosphopantetheinyl transferase [Rhodothermus marinus SG0.5JP17-172]MBO2492932.1 4'-phosphopantetheinyl transferase superfamily protein [Rhodothermus marinus]